MYELNCAAGDIVADFFETYNQFSFIVYIIIYIQGKPKL